MGLFLFGLICRRLVRACHCAGDFIPIRIFLASGNVALPSCGIGSCFLSCNPVTNSHASKVVRLHRIALATAIIAQPARIQTLSEGIA